MIEGKSDDFPVVIMLHGGQGTPIPYCVGSRGLFPDLTNKCIMVFWDQYGCGINRADLPHNICINEFVQMTNDFNKGTYEIESSL